MINYAAVKLNKFQKIIVCIGIALFIILVLFFLFISIRAGLKKVIKTKYIRQMQDYVYVDEFENEYIIEYVDEWAYNYPDCDSIKWQNIGSHCKIYDNKMNLVGYSQKQMSNALTGGSYSYVEHDLQIDFLDAVRISSDDRVSSKLNVIENKYKEKFYMQSVDDFLYLYDSESKENLLAKVAGDIDSQSYIATLYENKDKSIGVYQVDDYIVYRSGICYGQIYIGDKVSFDSIYPGAKEICRLLKSNGKIERIKLQDGKKAEDILDSIINSLEITVLDSSYEKCASDR